MGGCAVKLYTAGCQPIGALMVMYCILPGAKCMAKLVVQQQHESAKGQRRTNTNYNYLCATHTLYDGVTIMH